MSIAPVKKCPRSAEGSRCRKINDIFTVGYCNAYNSCHSTVQ